MTEADRLAALLDLKILDTPREKEYDELVRLAAAICGAPISLVSLVDHDRQWFKAAIGIPVRETHRSLSFCAHAIHQEDVFLVDDATSDPRFVSNALVTGDPHIRFYAGVPLHAPGGAPVGTLCVIDTIPRHLSDNQREALSILATQVQARMELRSQHLALEHALDANQQLYARLEASQHMFRSFMEHSPTHAWVKDDQGRIAFYNREVEDFLGITSTEWLGLTIPEVVSHAEAEHYAAQDHQVLATGKNVEAIDELNDKLGRTRKLRSIKFSYKDLTGRTMLAKISLDITDQLEQTEALAKASAQLELLATTDSLTGLANRRVFASRAAIEFADWKRHHAPLSILVMDVDDFKLRNDQFGHAAGDAALRLIGETLTASVRIGDVAARIGGEEFAVLLPSTSIDEAVEFAHRFQHQLSQQDAGALPLTVSIGGAAATDLCPTWETLLSHADEAMYVAKRTGKNKVTSSTPEMRNGQSLSNQSLSSRHIFTDTHPPAS